MAILLTTLEMDSEVGSGFLQIQAKNVLMQEIMPEPAETSEIFRDFKNNVRKLFST